MSPHALPRALAAGLLAVVLFVGAVVGAVAGAAAAVSAQEDDVEFTADETAGDIDRIRTSLIVIAVATGALLVVYVWHTNPRRRMDVAVRRRAALEQEQMDTLDDAFLLPADAAAEADVDEPGEGGDAAEV